ncbi:MAG TPA: BolA/IbaG family iron-sulfur metabolism protein [Candidatus Azosocius sp. HAIN]
MISKKIKDFILLNFSNSEVFVKTSDEIHFEIIVINDFFINVNLIDRHRYIYSVINYFIVNKILHAVSLQTHTTDEWKKILKK